MRATSSGRVTAFHLVLGFAAGALATVAFHQVMVLILNAAGMVPVQAYSMRPIPPLGVPALLNSMFWGGLWGVVFALVAGRLGTMNRLAAGILFGLLGPLLVNWFVVSPLKGQPLAAGWNPTRMLAGVLILGAFGFGIALFYDLLRRWAAGRRGAGFA